MNRSFTGIECDQRVPCSSALSKRVMRAFGKAGDANADLYDDDAVPAHRTEAPC